MNFSQKKIMIGLSGGINSMAVLCWLGELNKTLHPKELHLFYADFKEHSDDTIQFVLDGLFWAKKTGSYFGRNKCNTGCAICEFD